MRLGVGAALVGGELLRGDVEVADGSIAAFGLNDRPGRGIAVPGFVDLQVNGFAGVDFLSADAAGYRRAGDALVASGVTAYQPTFITQPEDALVAALRELPRDADTGPRILGAHLEGPFISPARLGTHPAGARRDPDRGLLERLLAAGPVSQVTLAPELEGAHELIGVLRAHGVVVSCGHTDATAEEAAQAFERGASTVTHLFNAMRPFSHRDPGIAGFALSRDDVLVQLIVDRHHLAPETTRVVWRAARGRVALVTDAIAGAGLGDGRYRIGSVDIEVRDGAARRADGALAGSVLTMIESVRNLHELGASLAEALEAASRVPAAVARRPELGVLAPGSPADITVLDDGLEVERVLVRGRVAFSA